MCDSSLERERKRGRENERGSRGERQIASGGSWSERDKTVVLRNHHLIENIDDIHSTHIIWLAAGRR